MFEKMTLAQLRDLLVGEIKPTETKLVDDFGIGKYCIIRTYSAGVHCGILTYHDGKTVHLEDCRRIWSWTGALSLSEISQTGIESGEISVAVPALLLTEAIEIIPTTAKAEQCLRSK